MCAPRSAAISNVHYDVTFDSVTARQRQIGVAMRFTTDGQGPVVLSLPAWTPGAYEIGNFARWVENFAVESGGRPLRWDKVDYDSWRVFPAGAGTVTVRFDYRADTLDNAMAWSQPDFAFFNGTNLFLYPEGRGFDFPATVTVHAPAGWRVATSMHPAGAPRTYGEGNYHDLVDMPFMVGRFDVDSARIAERWVRFASYPEGSVHGDQREEVWSQLKRLIPVEAAVWGEVPWDTYTVMQVADSSYQGASGLEHQSSHLDIITPYAVGNPFMPSLYAHEIFHAWNVKRLRPAEMWPYRYDLPQPTPQLWISEGVTDYYADLAEVRGGVVPAPAFLNLTSGKINEVADVPPIALEDASVNTWIHPVEGSWDVYYPKGSLAGFLLDIMVRDASDNRASLDSAFRDLYHRDYKAGHGFTEDDWWGALARAANGKSFADFHARYVDGREPFPWDSVLPLAGFAMAVDSARVPRLGIASYADSTGEVRVSDVEPGSAAQVAGLQPGDVLLSVGDIPVRDAAFATRFRQKYGQAAEGTALPLRVRRGERTLTLASKLRFEVHTQARIIMDPNPSPKALKIRQGILTGTTEP